MKRALTFIGILSLVYSCSGGGDVPKDILPPKKMQAVLWDMISAGEFVNAFVIYKDSIDKSAETLKRYGQVFQLHKITKDQFDKSWLYYRQNPEKMRPMLDSLSKRPAPSMELDTTTRQQPDTIARQIPDSTPRALDTLRKRFARPRRLS